MYAKETITIEEIYSIPTSTIINKKTINVTETQADSITNDTNDKWVQTLYDLFTTGSHGEISGVPIILLSTVFN